MPAIDFTNLPPQSKVSIKGTLAKPIISFPVAEVFEWKQINEKLVYDKSYFNRNHIPWGNGSWSDRGTKNDLRHTLGHPNILNSPQNRPKFYIKLKGLNYCDARGENIWFYSTEDTREDSELAPPNFRYAEYQERIFQMFFRAHSQQLLGNGLGLYLVKKHVEKIGGSIKVLSSREDTVFQIIIPNLSI
jgi:hypothetical protein